MMAYTLKKALDLCESRMGPFNPAKNNWRYGYLTKVTYDHSPFSNVPILRHVFGFETEYAGNRRTPNVALNFYNSKEEKMFKFNNGAVFRMVIDLSDEGKLDVVMDVGIEQTNPLSEFRSSQNELW